MNARERFERTRSAVGRLAEVHALIMSDCDDWKPPRVKAANVTSDPTATQAIRNVDVIADKLTALRAEETELIDFIGETLIIIQTVRDGFGSAYAAILEARYIDCLKWDDVYSDCDTPKTTCHRMLDIAFDWIDSIGITRLLNGDTVL